MKSLGMKLNFLNDIAYIVERSICVMSSTTAAHYSLPLTKWDLEVENTNIVLHTKHISDLSKTEKENLAQKLHWQFAHALKEKRLKLVQESKL